MTSSKRPILRKQWRRYDSLQPFSENDAKRIYFAVLARHTPERIGSGCIGMIVSIALGGLLLFVGELVSLKVTLMLDGSLSSLRAWLLIPFVTLVVVSLGLAYSATMSLYVEKWIDDELKPKRANLTRCARCNCSLEGLPDAGATIRCPECSHEVSTAWRNILDDLGIDRPDDSVTP